MLGAQFQPLVRELRSHMLHSAANNNNNILAKLNVSYLISSSFRNLTKESWIGISKRWYLVGSLLYKAGTHERSQAENIYSEFISYTYLTY